MVDRLGTHQHADGREDLFLRDAHAGRDVDEQGRAEIVSAGVFWVHVTFTSHEAFPALVDSVGDQKFEPVEIRIRDHGAHVNRFWLVVERGADSEVADAGFEDPDQGGIALREGNDALNSDAVLARRGEDATEENAGDFGESSGVVQDDGWVFTTEFNDNRGQALGC